MTIDDLIEQIRGNLERKEKRTASVHVATVIREILESGYNIMEGKDA